jgi:hypothetical protein
MQVENIDKVYKLVESGQRKPRLLTAPEPVNSGPLLAPRLVMST